MNKSIKIRNSRFEDMSRIGWTNQTTTDDMTMLSEIERDYLGNPEISAVAFTWADHTKSSVIVWTFPKI